MSTLCMKYYNFLEHSIDLDTVLDNMNIDCDNIMSWCLQNDFINCEVQELIDHFPKYLKYSRFFDIRKPSSAYNQSKIYNSTTMSANQLRNEVSKDPLMFSLENAIKRVPEYLEDQIKEYTFQNNYSTSIDDLIFNKNFYYYNYNSTDYTDRFGNLLNSLSDDHLSDFYKNTLNKQSFFHLYFINSLINYIFAERTNLKEILLVNRENFTIPLLTDNINDHFENIVNVVLMNQFSFVNITDSFKEKIYQSIEIQEAILKLNDLFNEHINNNLNQFKTDVLETIFDVVNQNTSFKLLKKIFNSNSCFNFIKINDLFSYNTFTSQEAKELMNLYLMNLNFSGNSLSNFENDLYVFFIKTLNNNYSIRNYYYLLYLYRDKLQRFVNVIDLVATEYIHNNIRFDGLNHFSNFEHISTLFTNWSTCIRYLNFTDNLNKEITFDKIQSIIDNDESILKLSLIYAYQKQIESFVKEESFKNQVNEIQNDIYSYLRSTGILTENIDWCNCTDPLEIYLFFAFKDSLQNINTDGLRDYTETQLSNFEYNQFENEDEFKIIVKEFNMKNSYYFFEFYKAFSKSIITAVFSDVLHLKFSL